MTVREHYETHLARLYSWMVGDFHAASNWFQAFLIENNIVPAGTKGALDLGAGTGIQSVALAKLGFHVTAVDFNRQLLSELRHNGEGLGIRTIEHDIRRISELATNGLELITRCGDTLAHLDSKVEVQAFLKEVATTLHVGGKAVLSFRDYSKVLREDNRFIQVRSNETRILTCVLEYEADTVRVTDLLYEKSKTGWTQSVSSYNKVRIKTAEIVEILGSIGR